MTARQTATQPWTTSSTSIRSSYSEPPQRSQLTMPHRTIVRTLNESHHSPSYSGLGRANTTYPISAFITHLVYLQGTTVEVDEAEIIVRTPQLACWTNILNECCAAGVGSRMCAGQGYARRQVRRPPIRRRLCPKRHAPHHLAIALLRVRLGGLTSTTYLIPMSCRTFSLDTVSL